MMTLLMLVALTTAQDAKPLLDALKKANPEYQGKPQVTVDGSGAVVGLTLVEGASAISDLTPLRSLPLTSLRVSSATLKDLSPLRGLPLTTLDLQGCRLLTDLSPLQDMPLTSLTLYACRSLEDISALRNAKLTRINFEGSRIRDLSPLKGQPIVWARVCCPVLDLSPLAGMNLKHLDVGGGTGNDKNLSDLSALQGMKEMQDLRFDQTSVVDISVVKDMKGLKFLAMFSTRVKDLTPLEGLALESLFFDPRAFPPEQLRIVREMKSLKSIDVSWKSWPNPQSAETFWKRYDAGEYRTGH